jgi:hypothetical protein
MSCIQTSTAEMTSLLSLLPILSLSLPLFKLPTFYRKQERYNRQIFTISVVWCLAYRQEMITTDFLHVSFLVVRNQSLIASDYCQTFFFFGLSTRIVLIQEVSFAWCL